MAGWGGLLSVVRDINFNLAPQNVPVTVTPSDVHGAIETRGIWITPTTDLMPDGGELQRAEQRRVMALRRDQVPVIPRGAAIVAPEIDGGPLKAWTVDGIERIDADKVHVIVVHDPEAQLLLD